MFNYSDFPSPIPQTQRTQRAQPTMRIPSWAMSLLKLMIATPLVISVVRNNPTIRDFHAVGALVKWWALTLFMKMKLAFFIPGARENKCQLLLLKLVRRNSADSSTYN